MIKRRRRLQQGFWNRCEFKMFRRNKRNNCFLLNGCSFFSVVMTMIKVFIRRLFLWAIIILWIFIFSMDDLLYLVLVNYGIRAEAVVVDIHKKSIEYEDEDDYSYIDVMYKNDGKECEGRIRGSIAGCEIGDELEVCFLEKYPERVYELENERESNEFTRKFRYSAIVGFLGWSFLINWFTKRVIARSRNRFRA